MTDAFKFGGSSRNKLIGVHPDLTLVLSRALLYSPLDFKITEGVRDVERQRELVEAGKSHTMRSKHLRGPGGARAVDVMVLGDLTGPDGVPDGMIDAHDFADTWNREHYVVIDNAVQRAASELGIPIQWGGHWLKSFKQGDCPHFELKG